MNPIGTVLQSKNDCKNLLLVIRASSVTYLDVDVVLALGDDLDVGVMDGLLVVLYAC